MTQVTFQTTALATPPDGTNVDVNAGTNSDATQRVTIATDDALNTVLGATSDAASASTSIKAALRGIATALGITAFDLGSGTGGSRTLRMFKDTAQWVGGSGSNGTAVQRFTIATDDTMAAAVGTTADAASATTSLSAKLRAIATALGTTALDLGSGTAGSRTLRFFADTAQWIGGSGSNGTAVQRVTVATDDALNTILGTTSGAKVVTDATGTVQQYLRGLVSMFAAGLSISGSIVIAAGSSLIGAITPQFSSTGIVTLQSNATGTTYNAFSSQACVQATLVNDTGVDLEVRFGGAGSTFILWANTAITIPGISNISTIGYRRKDTSNTQVTLAAFWNS